MPVNGVIGTYTRPQYEETVIAPGHPGPVRNLVVKTGQGVLKKGLIVAKDASGLIVPYDPAGTDPVNKPVGVLFDGVDTDRVDVAPVIVHGTVYRNRLLVGENEPSADDLAALEAITIWPVG